jgi:hypothetical protein
MVRAALAAPTKNARTGRAFYLLEVQRQLLGGGLLRWFFTFFLGCHDSSPKLMNSQ